MKEELRYRKSRTGATFVRAIRQVY